MLLDTQQCTGLPAANNDLVPDVSSTKAEKP